MTARQKRMALPSTILAVLSGVGILNGPTVVQWVALELAVMAIGGYVALQLCKWAESPGRVTPGRVIRTSRSRDGACVRKTAHERTGLSLLNSPRGAMPRPRVRASTERLALTTRTR